MDRIAGCFMVVLLAAACPSLLAADTDAASLFKSKCVLCHAENGSGNRLLTFHLLGPGRETCVDV